MSGVSRQPDGAAFDIVLLLHVGCVVAGLATTITSAATASRLKRLIQRSVPLPESMNRYFAPGPNRAGRIMYGIPVFGFALVAMSQGAYSLRDGWVTAGLGIFVLLVLVAEGVLWPAERRLQDALAPPLAQGIAPEPDVLPGTRTMVRAATACVVLLVAGTVLMLAQP
jgi:hypothetical protein